MSTRHHSLKLKKETSKVFYMYSRKLVLRHFTLNFDVPPVLYSKIPKLPRRYDLFLLIYCN